MTDLSDQIRRAVQAVLDQDGDGYHVAQLVVCMGIERVNAAGEIESAPWWWAPTGQPEWMTDGLIESVVMLRAAFEDAD